MYKISKMQELKITVCGKSFIMEFKVDIVALLATKRKVSNITELEEYIRFNSLVTRFIISRILKLMTVGQKNG